MNGVLVFGRLTIVYAWHCNIGSIHPVAAMLHGFTHTLPLFVLLLYVSCTRNATRTAVYVTLYRYSTV